MISWSMPLIRGAGLFLSLACVCAVHAPGARAESALHALGEASNNRYHQVRSLGPNPDPARVREINNKSFERFRELAAKEFDENRKRNLTPLTDVRKTAKLRGKPPGKGKPKGGVAQKGTTPPPKQVVPPTAAGRKANVTTGESGGAAGADAVKFGGARDEKKLNTVDGIIQEQ